MSAIRCAGWVGCIVLCLGLYGAGSAARAETIVIGSKNFSENRLLGEMFAQLLEAKTDLTVERRLGLAGTLVCFEALRAGAIDVYPEYTGTGLVTLLGEPPGGVARETLNHVRSTFLDQWNLWWLAPLGFENAYEIAVPRAIADRYGLRTISDLAAVSADFTAAFGYEFLERDDGLPGLEREYGLRFADTKGMQQALKYQSAGAGAVDCLDVYTTDGRLLVHDLLVLDDDRNFFPPYEAAALVRGATLELHPEVGNALALLSGALDEETMRQLNLRLQEHGESEPVVARDALAALGLVVDPAATAAGDGGAPRRGSVWSYMWGNRDELALRLREHLSLSALALLLGALVAIPCGMLLERSRRMAEGVIRVIGVTQTIPSIALLAFMIPLLGVGSAPALVALWIYSLFPIVRNTYTGVSGTSSSVVGSAAALGMTPAQVLFRVRLPLAIPVIMAGVRTAAVITIGTTTLAAFIGAGGLGVPIVAGLQLADTARILSGAIPAAVLALAVDAALQLVERTARPRGLKLNH